MTSGYLNQVGEDGSPSSETGQQVVHGSFSLPTNFSVTPARVFSAFAEPSLRTRWFRLPGSSKTAHHELDFRVDGGEIARNVSTAAGFEERLEYRSRFLDIVPDERIVFVYEVHVNGVRRWASLVTIEFASQDAGCRLVWTEQYAYLALTEGGAEDIAHLRGGTRLVLNGLSVVIEPDRHESLIKSRTDI